MDLVDPPSEYVTDLARTGDVRGDRIQRHDGWCETSDHGVHRRWQPARELERQTRRTRLPLLLERAHFRRDAPQALAGIGDVDRQPCDHRRDQIAERQVLLRAAEAHRHERPHAQAVGRDAAAEQPSAEGAGHDGEDHVVHLALGGAADGHEVVERKGCPHDAPLVGDRGIEWQRRAGLTHEGREGADRAERVTGLLEQRGRLQHGAHRGARGAVGRRSPTGSSGAVGRRAGIRHHLEQLRAAHAVDHGVMDLAEDGRPSAGKTVDQIGLPEGSLRIQGGGEQRVDQRVKRRVVAGRRNAHVPDVMTHVERGVVLPVGPPEIQEGSHGTLVVPGDPTEPLGQRFEEGGEGNRPVQHGDAADVQAAVRLLVIQEGRIEGAEARRVGHTGADASTRPTREIDLANGWSQVRERVPESGPRANRARRARERSYRSRRLGGRDRRAFLARAT